MKFEFCYRMVLAAMLLALPPAAQARDLDHDEALRLRQEGVIRPLEALIATAFARYPGAELLEAELEEEDDVLVYEVELLTTEGIVRELELDARDGRILKDEVED